jgi:outer membrane receptor protein involved in Fe transport
LVTVRLLGLVSATLFAFAPLAAQSTGTVQGTITGSDNGRKLAGVTVTISATGLQAVSGTYGRYTLERVPSGEQTLLVRMLGFAPLEVKVTVTAGGTTTADAKLELRPIVLSEIMVSAASRTPERVVDAPAAVTLVDPQAAQSLSLTGQLPLAIANVPGVDIVQSGVADFNVNSRGFNSSLNRRVLVLQDGRDLAIPFLGAQEWNATTTPLEEVGRLEMVRGPGSALYGANAFAGVLNITTPSAREVVGTKLSLGGGELSSFRGDLRYAGILGHGQFGYKVTGGYSTNDTWSRSRTARDSLDLAREYAPASDSAAPKGIERAALNGQTVDPVTGVATGDRNPLANTYGTARFDYYANNGAVGTAEGGASQVENEIFVTGIGRVQVVKATRPWARVQWAHENYNLMAWWSGRRSPGGTDPGQIVLASGGGLVDLSNMLHIEGQYNRALAQNRFHLVVGGAFRNYHENTESTLMLPADDNRNDKYYSGYGQVEYRPTRHVRAVAAGRFDGGDLFQAQISPKGALVFTTPNERHSFRLTFNRAFQTPNYAEFFLRATAAPPTTSPAAFETALKGYLQAVRTNTGGAINPPDPPWNFSAQTQVLAVGNKNLDVEKVASWEFGYKGSVSSRVFVSADLYLNQLTNFVTDLLPNVNPDYPFYDLKTPVDMPTVLTQIDSQLAAQGLPPTHPLRAPIPALQANYNALSAGIQPLLATLPDGTRALVVSYTNAGKVDEKGLELGIGALLTDEVKLEASYTFFDFLVKEQKLGDKLFPNTAKHKGTVSLSYNGRRGLDASVSVRFVGEIHWAAGVYAGPVPATQTVNANVGYRINNNIRLNIVGTNVLDQKRYQLYGGSVIGRRVLGGLTATF